MKTKYSLKSHMYINNKRCDVDGPWKESVDDAIEAYKLMLKKKGLEENPIFNPFIAESCDVATASCIDSHGKGYIDAPITPELADKILNINRS